MWTGLRARGLVWLMLVGLGPIDPGSNPGGPTTKSPSIFDFDPFIWVKISGHIEDPRSLRRGMAEMPMKAGRCSINGCRKKPTEWHHIIPQGRIMSKGLDPALLTDPGNLVEFCAHHHAMTTASSVLEHPESQDAKSQVQVAAKSKSKKAKKKTKPTRCIAETGIGLIRGGRCRLYAVSGSDYCQAHKLGR